MTQIRYFFEALGLALLMLIFRVMPADWASACGGLIGRSLGPKLAASRKALRHIRLAFPDMDDAQSKSILQGMWDNLGRTVAEYPHLYWLSQKRVQYHYMQDVQYDLLKGGHGVLFSGHLGNWEVPPPSLAGFAEAPVHLMYRPPNNPYVDRMLQFFRTRRTSVATHTKSATGGKEVMHALKDGAFLAILIDQKYNEGIDVPFFGQSAMTNPFFLKLARRYKLPLVPCFQRRVQGAHFEITVYPPIDYEGRSDEDVLAECHRLLEAFITAHPDQWLWLHRRWRDI